MKSIIQKIDQIIEERSLLKHPFYEMWSEGKLEFDSLAGYSKEYFQLVKQVPKFMEPLIDIAPDQMKDEKSKMYNNVFSCFDCICTLLPYSYATQ